MPGAGKAALMTISVTAEIYELNTANDDGRLAGFSLGQTVGGSFVIDTATVGTIFTGTLGGAQGSWFSAVMNASFDGVFSLTAGSSTSSAVAVTNDLPNDNWLVRLTRSPSGGPNEEIRITGPASTNLAAFTNVGIDEIPDLSNYGPNPLFLEYAYSVFQPTNFTGNVRAYLTDVSIAPTATPEPAALGLLGLGLAGLGLAARRRKAV